MVFSTDRIAHRMPLCRPPWHTTRPGTPWAPLGHQSIETTGIYAKLDLEALAAVALPWGGGAL
jgi:hypothetical protein